VRDTLDSIVSPAVRDTLLAEALTLADERDVPGELPRFLEFLDGPLRRTLERALGHELGRSVVAELERLTEGLIRESAPHASGGRRARAAKTRAPAAARPTRPVQPRPTRSDSPRVQAEALPSTIPPAPRLEESDPPKGTAPTQPARPRPSHPRPPTSRDYPAGTASAFGMLSSAPPAAGRAGVARRLPVVFVATRDIELVRRFGAWLDPRAAVVRVSRLIDLLLDIQDGGDRKTVIVVDGHLPPIRPEALAALSEELPENVRVVLWGGAAEVPTQLSELFPRVAEWLVCESETPLSDVVDRCAEIVG
jgi:hypothetical protein